MAEPTQPRKRTKQIPLWEDGGTIEIKGNTYRIQVEPVNSSNPKAPKYQCTITLEREMDPATHVIMPGLVGETIVSYHDRMEIHDVNGLIGTQKRSDHDEWCEQLNQKRIKREERGAEALIRRRNHLLGVDE